jgi:uncharacterized membrane-anchored protein
MRASDVDSLHSKVAAVTLGFWVMKIAFVLTRPLGATFGDLLTEPLEKGGLGFGTVGSSLVLFTLLVTLVALPMLQRRAQPIQ